MSNTKRPAMVNDLTNGSVPKQLLLFAAPLVLSGLLQTVYNTVDMIVVGHFVGSAGLSAVSIGGDLLMLLTFVAMGISNAGQIIISQYVGAGMHDRVTKLIGTLFTFLLSCAVIMTVLCLVLQNQLLHWINTPAESMEFARRYVIPCVCGLFFIYGYNLVSAILRGMGDSKHPFLFIAIASVVNLLLDLLFVIVFDWDTLGAALATVVGQAVSFICALAILYRKRVEFGFDFKPHSFRISKEVFLPLLSLGLPMMLQSAAITFSKVFVTSWVNSYGVIASAVSGVGNKLENMVNTVCHAFSAAGGSMVAQNIGAGKHRRVPRIMITAFAVTGVLSLIMATLTAFWPEMVFGMFTTDSEVLKMAMTYIPIAMLLYVGSAVRPPIFSLINGSGNSKLNLAVALFDGIAARIGLAWLLGVPCGLGVYGFWYGNAIAGILPLPIGLVYYFTGNWRHSRILVEEGPETSEE